MKKKTRNNLFFYLFILIFFAGAQSFAYRTMITGAPPPIVAKTITGDPFDLNHLQGKPAVIYFWATWCGICKAMKGSINAIGEDYPIISLALKSGNSADVTKYTQVQGINVPVVLDTVGSIGQSYGILGVPTAFILGPDGTIRFSTVGYTTEIGLRIRLWLAAYLGNP